MQAKIDPFVWLFGCACYIPNVKMCTFPWFGCAQLCFELKRGFRKQPCEWWVQVVQDVPKKIKICSPGAAFEIILKLPGAAGDALHDLGKGFSFSLGSPGAVFFTIVLEACDDCISMPFSNGIEMIAGPGTQVIATWANKLDSIGPECLRSGQSERSGQSRLAGRI